MNLMKTDSGLKNGLQKDLQEQFKLTTDSESDETGIITVNCNFF